MKQIIVLGAGIGGYELRDTLKDVMDMLGVKKLKKQIKPVLGYEASHLTQPIKKRY